MSLTPLLRWVVTNWLITDPALWAREPTRNYHTNIPSNTSHIYICGARLKSTKQLPIHVGVFVLIFAAGVLFWVFEASWLWHNISPAVVIIYSYLWFLTTMFFIKAAGSDPGFAPKNVHVSYSPESIEMEGHRAPDEFFSTVSLPYYQSQKGTTVRYCITCHIWRTPRMSHCGHCRSCVYVHDHHCVFLNNCIGARNYRYFLWMLLLMVLTSIMLSVLGWIHVCYYLISSSSPTHSFSASISQYPVAFLLAIYGVVGFIYPLMLLVLHVFLSANNLTTREYLNYVRTTRKAPEEDRYVNIYNTQSMAMNLWNAWVAMPSGVPVHSIRGKYQPGSLLHEPLRALETE